MGESTALHNESVRTSMKKFCAPIGLAMGLILLALAPATAADDPSIPAQRKALVQQAMVTHIDSNRSGDHYVIYDAVDGKLLRLKLKELHAGVVQKTGFYVSCADFTTTSGDVVDVDFLVAGDDTGFRVLEGVVHKVGGTKRPYHLEEMTTHD